MLCLVSTLAVNGDSGDSCTPLGWIVDLLGMGVAIRWLLLEHKQIDFIIHS